MRGDDGTGWSLAWKINYWARFLKGDHAYKLIEMIFRPVDFKGVNYTKGGGSYPNLFDAHPPFQIDGNFGASAGILEMFMQSHLDRINLLPALPTLLPEGHLRGLCARGGFVLDFDWNQCGLNNVSVLSTAGNSCTLVYEKKKITFPTEKGKTYTFTVKDFFSQK